MSLDVYQEVLDVTLRYLFRPAWRSIIRLTMRVCGQAKDCLSCCIRLVAHHSLAEYRSLAANQEVRAASGFVTGRSSHCCSRRSLAAIVTISAC